VPIKRAAHVYGPGGASACLERLRGQGMQLPGPAQGPPTGTPLEAVVNQGRWVVECDVCSSAQLTDPDDRRFFCVRCLNAQNQGRWRPVTWPEVIAAIEQALEARPDEGTRNWSVSETLADLQAENQAHGVEVGG
jgi:hypothetical protein